MAARSRLQGRLFIIDGPCGGMLGGISMGSISGAGGRWVGRVGNLEFVISNFVNGMANLDMSYCVNGECPRQADCVRGKPNHPVVERAAGDVSPRVPRLRLGWFGDDVGNLGMAEVADGFWCDYFMDVAVEGVAHEGHEGH